MNNTNEATTKFRNLTAEDQVSILTAIGSACGEKAREFCPLLSDDHIASAVRNAGVYARRGPKWLSVLQVSYSSARNIASAITCDMPDTAVNDAARLRIEFAGFEGRMRASA